MRKTFMTVLIGLIFILTGNFSPLSGQAGRRSISNDTGMIISVTAKPSGSAPTRLTETVITVYDDGVEQQIKNIIPDQSPASIAILVDSSLSTLVDIEKLEQAAREFVYEIYENDKLFIVKYANEPLVESEWTDDAKLIESRTKDWVKKGEPHLFDAMDATIDQALQPLEKRKRVIVLITDGVDDSKTKFEDVLVKLQLLDITVYVLRVEDRTKNGSRGNRLRPEQVIEKLTTNTGGLVFDIENAENAAKIICDELRTNRYLLSYDPLRISFDHDRRILVIDNQGNPIRSKTIQPANKKLR